MFTQSQNHCWNMEAKTESHSEKGAYYRLEIRLPGNALEAAVFPASATTYEHEKMLYQ